jgi:hypothetical protein
MKMKPTGKSRSESLPNGPDFPNERGVGEKQKQ